MLSLRFPLSAAREVPAIEDPPLDRTAARGDGRPDFIDAEELTAFDLLSSPCDSVDDGRAILYQPPE